jgi:alpha-beta hydrolase superfamily lysophospholipase
MPLFAAAGWDASAVSLRAQGGSDRGAPPLKVSGTLASHADDLAAVVGAMGAPPVLIAHSFGALLAAKYLSRLGGAAPPPPLAGAALLAGVPPSGNGGVVGRIARRAPLAAARLTYGFIARSFARSADEARFMFFSDDLPAEDLGRYQALLAAGSPARLLDLGALKAELPVPLPPTDVLVNLPRFVGGGADDAIVDAEALAEAVAWLGLPPGTERIWPRTAHDCMLDTRWEAAARDVLGWLEAEVR